MRAQGEKRGRVEGEVGVDPADRPLPSDGEAPESQYAGWVADPSGLRDPARLARIRAAVAALKEDRAQAREAGRRALRRLRAEHAATAQAGNAESELLLQARCAACGEDVGRAALVEVDSLVLTAWRHHQRSVEATHPVRSVVL